MRPVYWTVIMIAAVLGGVAWLSYYWVTWLAG
jgi:hypothetical protein